MLFPRYRGGWRGIPGCNAPAIFLTNCLLPGACLGVRMIGRWLSRSERPGCRGFRGGAGESIQVIETANEMRVVCRVRERFAVVARNVKAS